jgi:hypothetical protein
VLRRREIKPKLKREVGKGRIKQDDSCPDDTDAFRNAAVMPVTLSGLGDISLHRTVGAIRFFPA